MHPRRPDIEAALTGLRTRVLGGKVVDAWGLEPRWPTQGPRHQRDAWLDSLAGALEAALTRKAFEPITIPDGRSPSH
ncbi:hypothetical protein D7Y23_18715 [Corallococcus sp. AB050B]|nr:hypothetical protein D7Y23_18715 [Corallococcus sp. AB050B]